MDKNLICAFGDSVLKGVVFDNNTKKYFPIENNFAHLSETALGVPIANFGKFGSTIDVVEKSFKRYYSQLKDYKYVVFECGGNDCDFNWKEISENPCAEHKPKSSISEFTNTYTWLINKVKELKKIPVLLSLPPIDAERYFNTIAVNLNKDNVISWLGGCMQAITNWHERYNLQVFQIARENLVEIIDITSPFLDMKDYRTCFCCDGIHPNELGHQVIAQSIRNFVSNRFFK